MRKKITTERIIKKTTKDIISKQDNLETLEQQIKNYLDYCENIRGMCETTLNMKRNVLTRFGETMTNINVQNLEQVNNESYNNWVIHEKARNISPRSLNMYNAIVLAMIRYFREAGMVIPLKIALVGKFKEGRVRRCFYSASEINRVVMIAKTEGNLAVALIIKVMFETGMRITEVTRLRLINFKERRITFIGKGRKPREVYLRPETLNDILTYIELYHITDYLWVGVSSKFSGVSLPLEPPTTATIRKYLQATFRAAGFDDFYPHALRHSFATDLQKRGASVAEIKEMIGHESITTTERYLHGFEGKLEELFNKYR